MILFSRKNINSIWFFIVICIIIGFQNCGNKKFEVNLIQNNQSSKLIQLPPKIGKNYVFGDMLVDENTFNKNIQSKQTTNGGDRFFALNNNGKDFWPIGPGGKHNIPITFIFESSPIMTDSKKDEVRTMVYNACGMWAEHANINCITEDVASKNLSSYPFILSVEVKTDISSDCGAGAAACAHLPNTYRERKIYIYQSPNPINITHEFGHSLGLIHEHQRTDLGLYWDYSNVNDTSKSLFYQIYPVFDKASNYHSSVNISYDPQSIMHYNFGLIYQIGAILKSDYKYLELMNVYQLNSLLLTDRDVAGVREMYGKKELNDSEEVNSGSQNCHITDENGNNITIFHNSYRGFFKRTNVKINECELENRVCSNGILSGTANYSACQFKGIQDCPLYILPGNSLNDQTCNCNAADLTTQHLADNGYIIIGTKTYMSNSYICAAALHAGAIDSSGGVVTVKATSSCNSYLASQQNGLLSTAAHNPNNMISFYFPKVSEGSCPNNDTLPAQAAQAAQAYIPPVSYTPSTVTQVACNDYDFSSWGACQTTNTQTRTIAASRPSGCVGTNGAVLSQSCTYAPGANLEATCGSANGGVFTQAPSTNLCGAGSTASGVIGGRSMIDNSFGYHNWSWKCIGPKGANSTTAKTITCSATFKYAQTHSCPTGSGKYDAALDKCVFSGEIQTESVSAANAKLCTADTGYLRVVQGSDIGQYQISYYGYGPNHSGLGAHCGGNVEGKGYYNLGSVVFPKGVNGSSLINSTNQAQIKIKANIIEMGGCSNIQGKTPYRYLPNQPTHEYNVSYCPASNQQNPKISVYLYITVSNLQTPAQAYCDNGIPLGYTPHTLKSIWPTMGSDGYCYLK